MANFRRWSLDTGIPSLVANLPNPQSPGLSLYLPGLHFVYVTPDPGLPGLDRPDERMLYLVKMFGRVLVLRRITASYVPAGQAEPQVDPSITHFHALFADVFVGSFELDLIQMRALIFHTFSEERSHKVK